ncbi:MAG: hypothetical protein U1F66_04760 [bacterium]
MALENLRALGVYLSSEKSGGEIDAAAELFGALAAFADASSHGEIRALAPLYDGYRLLALGDLEPAIARFRRVQDILPEAKALVTHWETDQKRGFNLRVLEAWEEFSREGEAIQSDEVEGLLGKALVGIDGWFRQDGKTLADDLRSKFQLERELREELRQGLYSGAYSDLQQGLSVIAQQGPEKFQARARKILAEAREQDHAGSYLLGHLIAYTGETESKGKWEGTLYEETEQLRLRYGAKGSAWQLYALLGGSAADETVRKKSAKQAEALWREALGQKIEREIGEILWDEVRAIGTDDLLQVALMGGAIKVGNSARLAGLQLLQKAGVTGFKALLFAGASGAFAEANALLGLQLGQEVLRHDPRKVLTREHLARAYGSNLIMIFGLKGAGGAAPALAPRLARGLGLTTAEGARLSGAGELLAQGAGHGAGLSAMIATAQVNQALGWQASPRGGLQENVVHEVFNYLKYAIAQRGFDRMLGKGWAEHVQRQHREIAMREAELLGEAQVVQAGYALASKDPEGRPRFATQTGQRLFEQWRSVLLSRSGFNGDKLATLLARGERGKAESYALSFGLNLQFEGGRLAGLSEIQGRSQAPEKSRGTGSSAFRNFAVQLALSPLTFLGVMGGGAAGFGARSRRSLLIQSSLGETRGFEVPFQANFHSGKALDFARDGARFGIFCKALEEILVQGEEGRGNLRLKGKVASELRLNPKLAEEILQDSLRLELEFDFDSEEILSLKVWKGDQLRREFQKPLETPVVPAAEPVSPLVIEAVMKEPAAPAPEPEVLADQAFSGNESILPHIPFPKRRGEPLSTLIIAQLQAHPEGLMRTHLRRLLSRSGRNIQNALDTLLERGVVEGVGLDSFRRIYRLKTPALPMPETSEAASAQIPLAPTVTEPTGALTEPDLTEEIASVAASSSSIPPSSPPEARPLDQTPLPPPVEMHPDIAEDPPSDSEPPSSGSGIPVKSTQFMEGDTTQPLGVSPTWPSAGVATPKYPKEIVSEVTLPEAVSDRSLRTSITLIPAEGERAGLMGFGDAVRLFCTALSSSGQENGRTFQLHLVFPNQERWGFRIMFDRKGFPQLADEGLGTWSKAEASPPHAITLSKVAGFQFRFQASYSKDRPPLAFDLQAVQNQFGKTIGLTLPLVQPKYEGPRNAFIAVQQPAAPQVEVLGQQVVSSNTIAKSDGMRVRHQFHLSNGDFVQLLVYSLHHAKGRMTIEEAKLFRLGEGPDQAIPLTVISGGKDTGGKNTLLLEEGSLGFHLKMDLQSPKASSGCYVEFSNFQMSKDYRGIWVKVLLPEVEAVDRRVSSQPPLLQEGEPSNAVEALEGEIFQGNLRAVREMGVLARQDSSAAARLVELHQLIEDPTAIGSGPELRVALMDEILDLAETSPKALDYLTILDQASEPEARVSQRLLDTALGRSQNAGSAFEYFQVGAETESPRHLMALATIACQAEKTDLREMAAATLGDLTWVPRVGGPLDQAGLSQIHRLAQFQEGANRALQDFIEAKDGGGTLAELSAILDLATQNEELGWVYWEKLRYLCGHQAGFLETIMAKHSGLPEGEPKRQLENFLRNYDVSQGADTDNRMAVELLATRFANEAAASRLQVLQNRDDASQPPPASGEMPEEFLDEDIQEGVGELEKPPLEGEGALQGQPTQSYCSSPAGSAASGPFSEEVRWLFSHGRLVQQLSRYPQIRGPLSAVIVRLLQEYSGIYRTDIEWFVSSVVGPEGHKVPTTEGEWFESWTRYYAKYQSTFEHLARELNSAIIELSERGGGFVDLARRAGALKDDIVAEAPRLSLVERNKTIKQLREIVRAGAKMDLEPLDLLIGGLEKLRRGEMFLITFKALYLSYMPGPPKKNAIEIKDVEMPTRDGDFQRGQKLLQQLNERVVSNPEWIEIRDKVEAMERAWQGLGYEPPFSVQEAVEFILEERGMTAPLARSLLDMMEQAAGEKHWDAIQNVMEADNPIPLLQAFIRKRRQGGKP